MIDLHIHTNLSDGNLSIEEVLKLIKIKNIKYFSITDHDRLQRNVTLKKIYEFCKKNDLKFIEGVEVSSKLLYKNELIDVHILGYGVKNKEKLNNFLEDALKIRAKRNIEMYYKIKEYLKKRDINIDNIINNDNEIKNIKVEEYSRVHFAKILKISGIVKNINEAFDNYISSGKPLFVPKKNVLIDDVIKILNKTCKYSIVAHFGITFSKFNSIQKKKILEKLKCMGIKGFEVFYSKHADNDEKLLLEFVLKNNLVFSAGSDFHGKGLREVEIGQISKNFTDKYKSMIISSFFK